MTSPLQGFEVVEERLTVDGRALAIVRPRSAEELIDEVDFDADERLPYWAELWPSGRVLAEAIAGRHLTGVRAVELGAGLAVPSLVAARAGAIVLATDWYEPALAFARANAGRLGIAIGTMLVDWRDPPPALVAMAPFDLVLAADVLYEARHAEPLLALVPVLAGDRGEVIVADPRRPDARELVDGLVAGGWDHELDEVRYAGRRDESGSVVQLHRLRPPGAAVQASARPSDTLARNDPR